MYFALGLVSKDTHTHCPDVLYKVVGILIDNVEITALLYFNWLFFKNS